MTTMNQPKGEAINMEEGINPPGTCINGGDNCAVEEVEHQRIHADAASGVINTDTSGPDVAVIDQPEALSAVEDDNTSHDTLPRSLPGNHDMPVHGPQRQRHAPQPQHLPPMSMQHLKTADFGMKPFLAVLILVVYMLWHYYKHMKYETTERMAAIQ